METPYDSYGAILNTHGLFAFIGFLASRVTLILPTGILNWIAMTPRLGPLCVDSDGRAKPVWQDSVVLALAIVTLWLFWAGTAGPPPSTCLQVLSWILLADMVSYHARVLWFDDLQPHKLWVQLRVASHRRVFFQALINLAESVLLFAVLYGSHLDDSNRDQATQASFEVATTLSRPEALRGVSNPLVNTQVAVSLFFLVVVISIVASVGYAREEAGPRSSQ